MKTVGMLLQEKGRQVWTIEPEMSVLDALRVMAEKNIGALPVVKNGEVVGIFSERDYARKGELTGRQANEVRVADVMTPQVICVRTESSIEDCMGLMTSRRFRHLPVLEDDNLTGIISIGDVVKAIISDQAFLIEQLERYITLPR